MPTAAQVKALIRSHSEGDEQRFYSVALQVAAQAARQGHNRFAIELRDLIDRAKVGMERPQPGQVTRPVPMVQPRGELAGLLTAAYPKTRLSEMALNPATHDRIKRVLTEQRDRAHIQSHGLAPLRRLLLVGPPGTGKTMTAAALAGELSIPLFSIQLHSLITKYLGETAAKLRLVFDAMSVQCIVYRLKDLAIITPTLYGQLFALFGRLGWRKKEPDPLPREETRRFQRLCFRALAERILSESRTAELLDVTVRCLNQMLDAGATA